MVKQFGQLTLYPFHQKLCTEQVDDIFSSTQETIRFSGIFSAVSAHETVCIGVPSRGISCMREVLSACVKTLLEIGAKPFIVPAMGSHGGGTAQGQREVLAGYGISEESLGIPVKSEIRAEQVGEIEFNGHKIPVYWDQFAVKADHILVVNRIKEHTAFTGPVESGLMKIMTVGLGKPEGAKMMHQAGLKETIPVIAGWLMENFPVLGGIAIVENGLHQPLMIEAVPANDISTREPELLDEARKVLPRIPFDELDVLIIGEMGKDISGTGVDTNVIGKYRRNWGVQTPVFRRIVVLDLTESSHGNATGVGFADIITQQLYDKIDLPATQLNCLTAGNFNGAKIPVAAQDAQQAVEYALMGLDLSIAKVAYIDSTLALETIWISEALRGEAEQLGLDELH